MGDVADSYFVQLLNTDRWSELPAPDPVGDRMLPPTLPTKFAVLTALSKKCWISSNVVNKILADLGYKRSLSSIRRALVRCLEFGLVQKQDYHKYESGVLRGKKNRRHIKWRMTERGRQLILSPPQNILKGKKKQAYASANQTVPSPGGQETGDGRVHQHPHKVLGP